MGISASPQFVHVFLSDEILLWFHQERKFLGGSSQISECMARELGDRVKLQSAVYGIDQSGDMVEVKTVNGETYKVSNFNSQQSLKEPSTCTDFISDMSLSQSTLSIV